MPGQVAPQIHQGQGGAVVGGGGGVLGEACESVSYSLHTLVLEDVRLGRQCQ